MRRPWTPAPSFCFFNFRCHDSPRSIRRNEYRHVPAFIDIQCAYQVKPQPVHRRPADDPFRPIESVTAARLDGAWVIQDGQYVRPKQPAIIHPLCEVRQDTVAPRLAASSNRRQSGSCFSVHAQKIYFIIGAMSSGFPQPPANKRRGDASGPFWDSGQSCVLSKCTQMSASNRTKLCPHVAPLGTPRTR